MILFIVLDLLFTISTNDLMIMIMITMMQKKSYITWTRLKFCNLYFSKCFFPNS